MLTALLFANFLLYLPSLFEPISYGDECIYLTLGNALRKGLVFYRDIHDNKPPLLYFVAALSNGNLVWFRLVAIIWNLIHLAIIYQFIKHFTKKRVFLALGGIIFSYFLLIFEGRIANGEIFMTMPVTLAAFLLLTRPRRKSFSFGLLLGFLFSLGFLFKVPVAFDLLGIFLAMIFFMKENLSRQKLLGIFVGFTSPIVFSILYYSLKGAFVPYVRSALLQNIGYLSSWQGSSSGLIYRLFALAFITGLLSKFRKKISPEIGLFFTWFLFSLFGALLSGRPYPHYLIEVVPSLTLLITVSLAKKQGLFFAGSAGLLLLFAYLFFRFWHYPQISYYKNFLRYATGKIGKEAYYSFWGERTVENYRLAKFVNQIVKPEENIFVWGDAACVYAISRRLPPGRFTVNYHIFDFNGYQETLEAIQNKKTRLVIKLKEEKTSWPQLDAVLKENYFSFSDPEINDRIFVYRNHKMVK